MIITTFVFNFRRQPKMRKTQDIIICKLLETDGRLSRRRCSRRQQQRRISVNIFAYYDCKHTK